MATSRQPGGNKNNISKETTIRLRNDWDLETSFLFSETTTTRFCVTLFPVTIDEQQVMVFFSLPFTRRDTQTGRSEQLLSQHTSRHWDCSFRRRTCRHGERVCGTGLGGPQNCYTLALHACACFCSIAGQFHNILCPLPEGIVHLSTGSQCAVHSGNSNRAKFSAINPRSVASVVVLHDMSLGVVEERCHLIAIGASKT